MARGSVRRRWRLSERKKIYLWRTASARCFLLARKTRMAAMYLGAWIVLMVVVIYTLVLIRAPADPITVVQVEGVNYFADTLLVGGVILSLARAMTANPPFSATSDEENQRCNGFYSWVLGTRQVRLLVGWRKIAISPHNWVLSEIT